MLLAGLNRELMGPWGFKLRLRQPAGLAFLNTGTTGSFEAVERYTDRLDRYVRREVRYNGRPLVSFEDTENAITTFLWLGAYHELSWTAAGLEVSFDLFIAVLATVELDDRPDGLVVKPKRGTGGEVSVSAAANTVTNLCAITVLPLTEPSVMVPSHAGKKVTGGIMWHSDEQNPDGSLRRTAAIASATALTYLGFFEADSQANVEISESLRVTLT
jgi:hypothetical protein